MTSILRYGAVVIVALFSMSGIQESRAQTDPTSILTDVITQLQTGTPNQSYYGFQLWQSIAMQTGNTGIYPQLANLGDVEEVTVTGEQQLPQGMLYKMTAQHENGQSKWDLGISAMTNRIEYANFTVNKSHKKAPSIPGPKAPPGPTPSGGGDSSACKKFPNLC